MEKRRGKACEGFCTSVSATLKIRSNRPGFLEPDLTIK